MAPESSAMMMGAAMPERFGKQRNPVGVAFLCFITLGIYFVYWHYKVNKEMLWYDQRIEVSPSISAVAVSIGWLFLLIPSFVSVYNTTRRAQFMFADYNREIRLSPAVATILHFFLGVGFPMLSIFYPPYLQSKMNRFWRVEAAEKIGMGERRAA